MKIVAVVGDHANGYPDLTKPLGEWLAAKSVHLLTGGRGGVMESVSKAFVETPGRWGISIGVMPAGASPNPWVEIPIRTHLHGKEHPDQTGKDAPMGIYSRNHVNALTADIMIGLPGGKGTLAEMRLAKLHGKPVFGLIGKDSKIDELNLDGLRREFEESRIFTDFTSLRQALKGVL